MRSRHRQATQRSERVQRLHKFFTRKYADTFVGANSVRPFDLHDEIIKAVPVGVLLSLYQNPISELDMGFCYAAINQYLSKKIYISV